MTAARRIRLRTVSPTDPGWSRRRSGRGFRYLDVDGRALPGEDVTRCKLLVIPPAWEAVWICRYANGHIQSVGTDARGRRQYLYHPQWREQRDKLKHDHVLAFARKLPAARDAAREALAQDGMPREKALATAFRLLDLGYFRIGSDSYAAENGSYGLTTLERRHVHRHGDDLVFDFVAKSGVVQQISVTDPEVARSVETMRRRRSPQDTLLAFRDATRWRRVDAGDVNDYLKDLLGLEVSAKDFRTWHGTVSAAVALAEADAGTATARKRAVVAAVREVATELGNTPAVARSAYIDQRVIDLFHDGVTIAPALTRILRRSLPEQDRIERVEQAVLRMLQHG